MQWLIMLYTFACTIQISFIISFKHLLILCNCFLILRCVIICRLTTEYSLYNTDYQTNLLFRYCSFSLLVVCIRLIMQIVNILLCTFIQCININGIQIESRYYVKLNCTNGFEAFRHLYTMTNPAKGYLQNINIHFTYCILFTQTHTVFLNR